VGLITSLTNLRSQYALSQMRINRAQITAIDGDPSTQSILTQLDGACAQLSALQKNSEASNSWVTNAAAALDGAMSTFSGLAKMV
jgi:hypothetical protein